VNRLAERFMGTSLSLFSRFSEELGKERLVRFIFPYALTGKTYLLSILTVSFNRFSPYTSWAAAHKAL